MIQAPDVVLNGLHVPLREGETVLQLARRHGVDIPTLCHDERLEPAGCCRSCLVEIEGQRRLLPACATPARPGQVLHTRSERVRRHQRLLLGLYLSDHPSDEAVCETAAPCQIHRLARELDAPRDWTALPSRRAGRADRNPYVHFQPEKCILCARCTRYCAEVEGVNAITLAGRGSETTIATAEQISLLDSTCELCGGCIAVCPTGAMTEKRPLLAGARPQRELEQVRTTCNYCGVGCQLDLNVDRSVPGGRVVKVTSPPPGTPPNDGNLCVKGRFAYEFIHHPDRLKTPLVRDPGGALREASWEEALRRAARGLLEVASRHGQGALGFISSARCTVEENYLMQKLARAVFGTHNVHQCAAT